MVGAGFEDEKEEAISSTRCTRPQMMITKRIANPIMVKISEKREDFFSSGGCSVVVVVTVSVCCISDIDCG